MPIEEDIVVGSIPKNQREEIRVTLSRQARTVVATAGTNGPFVRVPGMVPSCTGVLSAQP